jgi:hypothetical protein
MRVTRPSSSRRSLPVRVVPFQFASFPSSSRRSLPVRVVPFQFASFPSSSRRSLSDSTLLLHRILRTWSRCVSTWCVFEKGEGLSLGRRGSVTTGSVPEEGGNLSLRRTEVCLWGGGRAGVCLHGVCLHDVSDEREGPDVAVDLSFRMLDSFAYWMKSTYSVSIWLPRP